MRWNCPHCGTALDVNDEKLGNGWSFSRCYRCSGHALIRRAEVNVIKVNGAPTGEQVLLPDSPPAKSNEGLLREQFHKTARALLNQPRQTSPTSPAALASAKIRPPTTPSLPGPSTAAAVGSPTPPPPSFSNPPIDIPDPLPETPARRSLARKIVPIGIAVAGTLAVSSAVYLYIEGQALWQKARSAAVMGSNETVTQAATQATAMAAALAAAANPALATTSSLSAPAQASTAPVQAQKEPEQEESAQAEADADTDNESGNETSAQRVTAEGSRSAAQASMLIRVLRPRTEIHEGPSSTYPTIALANPTARFLVKKWNKRWFKVEAYNVANNRALAEIVPGHKTGWIRNDLVEAANAD